MKLLIISTLIFAIFARESQAIQCMGCEINDSSEICDFGYKCPKNVKYCETLISKVNGNYSVVLSCATKEKCSAKPIEDGLEKCKHSKSNTECYTCCNDEHECNTLELALESLPENALSAVEAEVKPKADKKKKKDKKKTKKEDDDDDEEEKATAEEKAVVEEEEEEEEEAAADTEEVANYDDLDAGRKETAKSDDTETAENNESEFEETNPFDVYQKANGTDDNSTDKVITLENVDDDDFYNVENAEKPQIVDGTVNGTAQQNSTGNSTANVEYTVLSEDEANSFLDNLAGILFNDTDSNSTDINGTEFSPSSAPTSFSSIFILVSSIFILIKFF